MKQLFGALAVLLLGCFCLPRAALAETTPPAPKWNGPPCQDFAVCSIDPPDPNNSFLYPCYASIEAHPKMGALALSSVGFCQAARSMLVVPEQERDSAYAALTYWYVKYVAQLKIPRGGTSQTLGLELLILDMKSFETDWQAYKAAPSAATWQLLESPLANFGQFAEILD